MLTKVCTKCKLELPATNEFFSIQRKGKYGLYPSCKECRIILSGAKYRKNEMLHDIRLSYIDKLKKLGIKTDNLIGEFEVCSKVKLECVKGHVTETSISSISRTKGCRRCITLKPYWEITSILKNENYVILTNEDDFNGSAKSKIHYICPKGHKSYSVCSSIRAGRRCVMCSYDTIREIHRKDIHVILSDIEKSDYDLVELLEEYSNGRSKIKLRCNRGHEFDTTVQQFYNPHGCNECSFDKIRGENHYLWNGMNETLKYLRGTIHTWKTESLKNNNYKCELSYLSNLEIHHKYSFHKIVEEFFNHYNINFEDTIDKYSDEVIDIMTTKFNDFHNLYGLGVCLNVELHKLFHKIYLKKNNTPEQFEEFKQNYLNGKYDDVLPENLKSTSTQKTN